MLSIAKFGETLLWDPWIPAFAFACLLAAADAAALATVVDDKKECFDTTVACRAASLLS